MLSNQGEMTVSLVNSRLSSSEPFIPCPACCPVWVESRSQGEAGRQTEAHKVPEDRTDSASRCSFCTLSPVHTVYTQQPLLLLYLRKKLYSFKLNSYPTYFPHGTFHHSKATKVITVFKKHALLKSPWLGSLNLWPRGL